MARFSDTLAKIVEGWGIDRAQAEAKAAEFAERFPDAAQFEEQFTAWVRASVDPALDLSTLPGTLLGFVRDAWAGVADKDPNAHQGNV